MSESPLFEVELYAFEGTSGSFRLTPHEFDVEIGGERYERCPLERSALALGAEAAKSALELKLPPDHALVRHLLQATLTGEATAVRLRIARRDAWGDYWWLSGTRWMGRVLGVEVADDSARIRCESAQVSLKRIGLPLAAIADFTFNLGAGRLQTSTLRRRINQRDWIAASQELRRWVYGGGKALPGLVLRREAECRLLADAPLIQRAAHERERVMQMSRQ